MRFLKLLIFLFIFCLNLYISTYDLYNDVINPDGINWHVRTQNFIRGLKDKEYSETFSVYHPGTTLMWISGPLLNLFINNDIGETDAEQKSTFLERDYNAKLSLVIFVSILFFVSLLLIWKVLNFKFALFFGIIYSLEPFVIGMRRLYHLDYLMTILMFLSFLFLTLYSYKSKKLIWIFLSALFLALSLLTKSTSLIFLLFIPLIILVGKTTWREKLLASLVFVLSLSICFYAFLPAIWTSTSRTGPKYINKIISGITSIGVEGKKELGNSGESPNITLEDTVLTKLPNFYISSLFMRLSVFGGLLLVISCGVFLYFFIKKLCTRSKFESYDWLSLWSLLIGIAFLGALSFASKKSDRYEIVVFPFFILLISYFLTKLKTFISIPLLIFYIIFVGYELFSIKPYYLAYSNPLLGGIETRLLALDDSPFGIATKAAYDVVLRDRTTQEFFTVSGSKSIKAISVGAKFSRFPSCVTDYSIVYAFENKPTDYCVNKYILLDTVKVAGFDYWYVYKRLNQAHESN